MDQDRFWELLEAARAASGDCDAQAMRLQALLVQLPAEEIVSFEGLRYQLLATAYRWDLWGAAYHLKGGWCSDDSFLYFLGWLLAQGRATFEAAVSDPDSLVDHSAWAEWQLECEAILYAAMKAYEARTGEKLPDSLISVDSAGETYPLGERWDFDDDEEVRRRLPRLWAWMTT